ncbi:hypothetical protein HYR54_04000 [Candidatus Acetothermia bacterium]|nr:hypothetical protein [Candidatus Acetothermia bacterium]
MDKLNRLAVEPPTEEAAQDIDTLKDFVRIFEDMQKDQHMFWSRFKKDPINSEDQLILFCLLNVRMLMLPDQHFPPIYHDMINAKQYYQSKARFSPKE